MIQVHQIPCPLDEELTKSHIAHKLKCNEDEILDFKILKESFDGRKTRMLFTYSVAVSLADETKIRFSQDIQPYMESEYQLPPVTSDFLQSPIIVGFGPSGILAGLILAEAGLKPIIFDRGKSIEGRVHDVEQFFSTGILNPDCNVQFGEGGAGTFSDGKLTTRVKDPRIKKILQEFIEAGADPKIMYQNHPHIGTDQLRDIIRNMREKILRLKGTIYFDTKVTDFLIDENHQIQGVVTDKGTLRSPHVLLCVGHSAKDIFFKLYDHNVYMEAKDFALGVRIEHKQTFINQTQYGQENPIERLGAAEYRITHTAKNGRGVYSFCMCPGGVVVPSSFEYNTVVVNGMSYSQRNEENANAAILVQIPVSDFYQKDVLDGLVFQNKVEQRAYMYGRGQYKAPAQNVKDYLNHVASTEIVGIKPSYCLGVTPCDLHVLFSDEVNEALEEALLAFDKKMPGFIDNAVMTGVESRSSCPLRIKRDETCQSISTRGLYPCGEGAGYSGGIISSCLDGIRCAEALIKNNHSK